MLVYLISDAFLSHLTICRSPSSAILSLTLISRFISRLQTLCFDESELPCALAHHASCGSRSLFSRCPTSQHLWRLSPLLRIRITHLSIAIACTRSAPSSMPSTLSLDSRCSCCSMKTLPKPPHGMQCVTRVLQRCWSHVCWTFGDSCWAASWTRSLQVCLGCQRGLPDVVLLYVFFFGMYSAINRQHSYTTLLYHGHCAHMTHVTAVEELSLVLTLFATIIVAISPQVELHNEE